MGGVQVGKGEWGDECSVNGGDGGKTSVQTFSNLFLKKLTEGAAPTKPGAYFSISQPSPKAPTFSFGGGSHLGVP